jgi:polar amino acid transport system substrate-binding protein
MRDILARGGRLRVGVFPGSPLSMTLDRATGEMAGLGVELGRELARRLGVRFEPVEFQRIAEVIEAMKTGSVDFTLSNATAARAVHVAFSPTVVTLELGYLVPAASGIAAVSDVEKPGLRIGVTRGSTSQGSIPKLLPHARVVPAENSRRAVEMFERHELDLFATNKPTLFQMSDQMPGSRVLGGRWGIEHIAIAIPRGRESAMEYLRAFVEHLRACGLLAEAIRRAGLRGVLETP